MFKTEFSAPIMRMKDIPAQPGMPQLAEGNNFTISLNPDTREEADQLYGALSQGGADGVAPHDEFWGYWGTCKDRFGIRWMFNVSNQPQNK